ncbi:MAG TPA: class I SAM-dependent methyltransferase [Candidatus Paceibacterota bacterium]|nr:class I SAM-dependent methyltransferase [Candidatus Paceibacterota bacterium]
MTNNTERISHEIEHGKKLLADGAEDVWNWASPAGKMRADRRVAYLVEKGHITAADKVLEIGCGTGLFTRKMAERTGADITGVDISPDLLAVARKNATAPRVQFVEGNAMQLPFPDGAFDVVYGSSVLHHLDFDQSLAELFRVLKPGGRMVFGEPNMLNPQIFVQKNVPIIKKWAGDSPDETAIVRFTFARRMQKIGFSHIHIIPYDFLHPAIPAALIPFFDTVGKTIERIPLLKEIAGSVIIYGEK